MKYKQRIKINYEKKKLEYTTYYMIDKQNKK
jgi:hypothetical protein